MVSGHWELQFKCSALDGALAARARIETPTKLLLIAIKKELGMVVYSMAIYEDPVSQQNKRYLQPMGQTEGYHLQYAKSSYKPISKGQKP